MVRTRAHSGDRPIMDEKIYDGREREEAREMNVWDTGSLPEKEQFDFYHEVICRAFVPLLPIRAHTRGGFAARVETKLLGDITLASLDSPRQETHHGRAEVAATSGAYYFVNLQLEGSCRTRQRDVDTVVQPGQFTVLDTTEPFYLDFDRDWKMLSFRVPHAALHDQLSMSQIPLGKPIAPAGAGAAAISLTRSLWSNVGEVPAQVSASLGTSFVAAVAAALIDQYADSRVMPPEAMRQAILHYLRQNLTDEALSVATVSHAFSLSPRSLHASFKGGSDTFAASLRAIRMRRAAELLADRTRSITEIGSTVGYPEPSSFGRAFRQFHGVSASEFREMHKLSSVIAEEA